MDIIRKISVGADVKNAMHYVVGKEAINDSYTIFSIEPSSGGYDIFISDSEKQVFKWKHFNSVMPISVEFNIDFE